MKSKGNCTWWLIASSEAEEKFCLAKDIVVVVTVSVCAVK